MIYEHRPLVCRTFGVPIRDGDRYLGVLTLSHIGRLLRTEQPK